MSEYGIPLSIEAKQLLALAISDGLKKDVPAFKRDWNLITHNGLPFTKWDFIFTNVHQSMSRLNFECRNAKSGSWEFVLLYDDATHHLYGLMSGNRFAEVREQGASPTNGHYVAVLASLNEGFSGNRKGTITYQDELNLFNDDGCSPQEETAVLHEMIGDWEVERFVLVCLTQDRSELISLSAVVPHTDLAVAHEENWSAFIPVDYEVAAHGVDLGEDNLGNDDIEIELRDRPAAFPDDEIVAKGEAHRQTTDGAVIDLRDSRKQRADTD